MIRKEDYINNCAFALILLPRTEKNILDDIEQNGWFDPAEYLKRAADAGFYITNNQRLIMKWMPQYNDSAYVAEEKMYVLTAKLYSIRKHNRQGDTYISF